MAITLLVACMLLKQFSHGLTPLQVRVTEQCARETINVALDLPSDKQLRYYFREIYSRKRGTPPDALVHHDVLGGEIKPRQKQKTLYGHCYKILEVMNQNLHHARNTCLAIIIHDSHCCCVVHEGYSIITNFEARKLSEFISCYPSVWSFIHLCGLSGGKLIFSHVYMEE